MEAAFIVIAALAVLLLACLTLLTVVGARKFSDMDIFEDEIDKLNKQ